jgi:hypothetical protein
MPRGASPHEAGNDLQEEVATRDEAGRLSTK